MLAGIEEKGGDAFLVEELVAFLVEGDGFLESARRLLSRCRGRSRPRRPRLVNVRNGHELDRRPHQDDGVLELALVAHQLLRRGGVHEHYIADDLPISARRPPPRGDGQFPPVLRLDDVCMGRPALPAFGQQPRFLMNVDEAIRLHLRGDPLVSPLQIRGTGQAGANLIAEVGQVLNDFVVGLDLGDELVVKGLR